MDGASIIEMLQKEEGWRHCILLLICAFDKFYIQKIACCVLVQKIVSVGPPWIEILATPLSMGLVNLRSLDDLFFHINKNDPFFSIARPNLVRLRVKLPDIECTLYTNYLLPFSLA